MLISYIRTQISAFGTRKHSIYKEMIKQFGTHSPVVSCNSYFEYLAIKIFSIITFNLFCTTALFSQSNTFIVHAGDNPAFVLPISYRFLNNEYKDGFLSFQMGIKSGVFKFNYDLLVGHLTFISEKKDTMVIKEDVTVKYLYLGKDAYYHDVEQGFFKILAIDTLVKLASHVQLVHYTPTNIGYGTTKNVTTAITTVSRDREVTFERITKFVFIDRRGSISSADRVGFLKMFRNKDDSVKSYLKKNKIDVKKEEDLVNLFRYCQSLGATR